MASYEAVGRRRRIYALCLAGFGGACADIFGITGGTYDGGSDGSVSDVAPDVPFDGGYVNPDGNYAVCEGGLATITPDAGWYVTKTGGSDMNDCSFMQPCATIQAAVAKAVAGGGGTVFIAAGTYPEQVVLSGGQPMVFQGGFYVDGGGWVPACDPNLVVIGSPPATVQSTVKLLASAEPVTFSLVRIVNDLSSAPGETLYGIASFGADLTLDNVEIFVAPGGNGITSSTQSNTAPTPTCGWPGDGRDGDSGASGGGGGINAINLNGQDGGAGAPGEDGHNGGIGGMGQCDVCGASGCMPVTTPVCLPDAGGTFACVPNGMSVCGSPGTPGCGGIGGAGGDPGTSGGSSIGVYLAGGSLVMTYGAITAGDGGNGGNGAMGGVGKTGSVGEAGANASCSGGVVGCSPYVCGLGGCMPDGGAATHTLSGGTAGGGGGAGGNGGQGGGGAGGWSYCIYAVSGAKVTENGVKFEFGHGGQGGAANGPPGVSAATNGDF